MRRETKTAGVWMEWTAPFDTAQAGDLELTVPELAQVFVERGLARVLEEPPQGSRGKAYITAAERRDGGDAAPRVRRPAPLVRRDAGRVVSVDERRPHVLGYVLCLECGEAWMSARLADADETQLECPACGGRKSEPIGKHAALIARALARRIERCVAAARETRS